MKKNNYLYKEVIPVEIPISYSNKFLKNIDLSTFSEKTVQKHTIPMNYLIPKTNGIENRLLSLPHPIAQLQMMGYINTYKYNIINFCSLSPYSIRSPQKLNTLNFSLDKFHNDKINYYNSFFSDNLTQTTLITKNDLQIEFKSFFSYKKYNNLLQFKNSIAYHRSKLRFDNYMNIDIRNFFSSIYTHSLEWAITGSIKRTKDEITFNDKDRFMFRKITDKICQVINYNETNGIIVGPEFSRIISEILLTRIDLQIAKKLKEKGLNYNIDYIIYRFIDDYTIFYNNPNETNENIIKNTIADTLLEYKLLLNTEKYIVSKSLQLSEDTSIDELKQLLSKFIDEFNKGFKFGHLNNLSSSFMTTFSKFVKCNLSKKVSIVRYTLKKFTELIDKNSNSIKRQLILDLSLFVLAFSPEHFAVQNMNSLILKYRETIKQIEDKTILEEFDTEYINRLIKFLKKHLNYLDQVYELITTCKYLTIDLPSTLLCSLLDNQKRNLNYFVICSIANYILDLNDSSKIHSKYRIVLDKIAIIIKNIIDNNRENTSRFIEAEYFYLINDFNHYSVLQSPKYKMIKDLLDNENKHFFETAKEILPAAFSVTGIDNMTALSKTILQNSYFRWNLSYEKYLKINILKSLNTYKNNPNTFRYS